MFKEELNIMDQVIDEEYQESEVSESEYKKPKNSTAATIRHRFTKILDQGSQTDNSWIRDLEDSNNRSQKKADRFKTQLVNVEAELITQISQLQRDKENLRKDVSSLTGKLEKERFAMKKFYKKMNENSQIKNRLQAEKEELFMKILQVQNQNLFKT